ncbi:MAG TPA: hypothetical protein VFR41_14075 [Acidimicrobiia bacterium]|nr:hypothetical protein [Acidimicrobiia bacterium]
MRFTLRTIVATSAIALTALASAAPAHAYSVRTRGIDQSGSIVNLSTGDSIGDANARINHHKLAAFATVNSELPAGTYEVNYLFSDFSNTQSILHPSVTHVCTHRRRVGPRRLQGDGEHQAPADVA